MFLPAVLYSDGTGRVVPAGGAGRDEDLSVPLGLWVVFRLKSRFTMQELVKGFFIALGVRGFL